MSSVAAGKLAGLRVLIAEDEPAVRASVRRLMERRGAIVITVADGGQATAILHEQRASISSCSTCRRRSRAASSCCRPRATQAGVPVVMMSGYTEDALPSGALFGQPDAFVEKPFSGTALDIVLDGVLRERPR